MTPQSLGRYPVIRKLGDGGMATVWLAQDTRLQRLVAIKVLRQDLSADPTWLKRFHDEAAAVARLGSPHVIQVYDFGQVQADEFLVMEYAPGWSLTSLLPPSPQPISPLLTASLGVQIARGLQEAHKAGIVHRDIKPDNLLVRPDGMVKIADFGIARITEDVSRTRTGSVFGSPLFMAPEQIRGESPTPAIDAFALGGILYRLFSGHYPFDAEHPHAVMWRIVSQDTVPLETLCTTLDPKLLALVKSLHHKTGDQRPTMAEVVEQLQAYLSAYGVSDPCAIVKKELVGQRTVASESLDSSYGPLTTRSLVNQSSKSKRRKWLLASLALLTILALSSGLWLYLGQDSPTKPTSHLPSTVPEHSATTAALADSQVSPSPPPFVEPEPEVVPASQLTALLANEAPYETNAIKPRLVVRNNTDRAITGFRVNWTFFVRPSLRLVVESYWTPGCQASIAQQATQATLLVDCPSVTLQPGQVHPSADGLAIGIHDQEWKEWPDRKGTGLTPTLQTVSGVKVSAY